VIATDLAPEMLHLDRGRRPPGVAGDALALPFRNHAFDLVLAPFSLNHLPDPALGVREAGRIATRLLASTYAEDDDHPVKVAVELALGEHGWERPAWYTQLKISMKAWGTVPAATEAIERGGLRPTRVEHLEVVFDDLGPNDMVAWRLGLAQCAPFMATLDDAARVDVGARAIELLGPTPPKITRRVIFLAAERR
jgi:SAM-dependent methyltransferase